MDEPAVTLECQDSCAVITMDADARRNALSSTLMRELLECLRRASDDESIHVIVLRAQGKAFCSGLDLQEALSVGMTQATELLVQVQAAIVAASVPVIARVHGPVRAGGLGLLTSVDVAVCADDVTFSFNETSLGVAPAAISLTARHRLQGRKAHELLLTAKTFTADQAVDIGLVTEAVTPDELDTRVAELVGACAAASRQGLVATKALFVSDVSRSLREHGSDTARLSADLFASNEAQRRIALATAR